MRNLVLDCETVNNPNAVGWENYKAIGISVAVVWDIDADKWYVFTGQPHIEGTNPLSKLPQLLNGNNIIGHNILGFDIPLVKAVAGDFKPGKFSDFWRVIYDLTGDKIKLNDLAYYAGVGQKTMHGREAPRLWQLGKYDDVIEYCKDDVLIEGLIYIRAKRRELVFLDKYKNKWVALWVENGELKAGYVHL